MPAPVLQFKRGIFSNLPGLRTGEPGFTTDSYELYVGIDSTTQNNKFFGSHRYWTRETTTTGSGVNLVEGSNNGSDYITLASPGTVGAAVTYYFPAANGTASSVLTNDGSGNLSWASGSADPVFTGIATFSDTTDNTLGDENTGTVQIDGGVGIAKNLTVKENLHVGGYAEFVGVVTFRGGTINIGDGNTDDINVGGEFISSLVPNVDDTHDLGITTQRWRNLNIVSVATSSATVSDLTAGRVVLAGTLGALEDSANLTFSGAGLIVGAGGINVTGVSTFSTDLVVDGDIKVGGNDIQASDGATNITLTSNTLTAFAGDIKVGGNDIQASDGTTAITLTGADVTVAGDLQVGGNDIKASDGTTAITLAGNDVTVADNLTVEGNLYVKGSTTQVNTAALTVEDRTIDLGIVSGDPPAGNTTWDLGILFNYYATNAAKKSAVIWEHADARFKFASVLAADTDGNSTSTPQLTVTTFAPIEIASLFVNDCAGASQVISCTGTERFLENITVDGGQF
jgi:hypothetical protein